jgi:hypothetical protein
VACACQWLRLEVKDCFRQYDGPKNRNSSGRGSVTRPWGASPGSCQRKVVQAKAPRMSMAMASTRMESLVAAGGSSASSEGFYEIQNQLNYGFIPDGGIDHNLIY